MELDSASTVERETCLYVRVARSVRSFWNFKPWAGQITGHERAKGKGTVPDLGYWDIARQGARFTAAGTVEDRGSDLAIAHPHR